MNALQRESAEKSKGGNLTNALQAAIQYNYSFENAYFFTFIKNDPSSVYSVKQGDSILKSLVDRDIDTSIISQYNIGNDGEANGYAVSVATQTNGMLVNRWNVSGEIYKHVYDQTYTVLLSSGLTVLPADFGKLSSGSLRDYDKDGLLDVEEINFEVSGNIYNEETYVYEYVKLIRIDENGSVILPTFAKCCDHIGEGKFYVGKGLEKYTVGDTFSVENYERFMKMPILPILSDPTSVDGDGDGILDIEDEQKLIYNKYNYFIVYDRPEHDFIEQAKWMAKNEYENLDIKYFYVTAVDEFINTWNSIDIPVETVHLFLHGGVNTLYFYQEEMVYNNTINDFNKLDNVNVQYKVYLYSCQGGTVAHVTQNAETNVAWELSNVANKKPVKALHADSVDYFRWYIPWSKRPTKHGYNDNSYWVDYYYEQDNGIWVKKEGNIEDEWAK